MESFSEEFLGIPKVIWKGILFLMCVLLFTMGGKEIRMMSDVTREHIWCCCVGSSRFSHTVTSR